MRVKICGIRRLEDASEAARLGAWALGFIFHRSSPRFLEYEKAAEIVSALEDRGFALLKVGVFVDRPLEEVNEVVRRVGLDVAQLHGDESPEYCRAVQADRVWKAFRVGDDFDVDRLKDYSFCSHALLDTYRPGSPGGTGETFDWDLARRASEAHSIVLAGGLRPDNIARAIRSAHPDVVDVSSGVEKEPGTKDHEQMRRLFEEIDREESKARG